MEPINKLMVMATIVLAGCGTPVDESQPAATARLIADLSMGERYRVTAVVDPVTGATIYIAEHGAHVAITALPAAAPVPAPPTPKESRP